MPNRRISLSDRAIQRLEPASSGQYLVRDSDLKGFMVLVGKRRKTFVIQGEHRRNGKRMSVRMKLGLVGEVNTRTARAQAKGILADIARGIDPRPSARIDDSAHVATAADPTLRSAWARYRDGHMKKKGRSEGTIENYRDHVERLLSDWIDEPLSVLGNDPARVAERHEKLTKENGPYIANGCMRSLRAIYNHARKTARSLPPENPVLAVDWNVEHRRDTGLGLGELDDWFAQLATLSNPLRREFHLFLLLSGHRPDAIKKVRVADIDFRERLLHIPKPKGGEIRAFDIPLSRPMIRCLIRAIRIGRVVFPDQAQEWVFAADSASGHIEEHKEKRTELSHWGNDLRQTYRTMAQAAGVPELDVHLLMNHSIPGVNAGYITRNRLLSDHLRKQQQAISTQILSVVASKPDEADHPTVGWLAPLSRALVSALTA